MTIRALNHFTIMSKDLDASREFYCGVLGMEVGPRPQMNFPGLWLYAAGVPILHLIGADAAGASRNVVIDHGGADCK
jgi:catechol 2,3-dioxygenase-like lactoylglutathione lyase family enzyme